MIKIELEKEYLERIKLDYLFQLNKKKFYKTTKNIIHNYWICNKDRIITAKPDTFQDIIEEFKALDQSGLDEFKTYMENQYKKKIDKYWLMKVLNIRTCPYCNRQYTFTIEKEKVVGVDKKTICPQFDHFYPQSKYPYLALSFYNLIPSCSICNYVKHTKIIDENLNPYLNGFGDECKFVLRDKNLKQPAVIDKKNIEVDFTPENKNIAVFGLKELYSEHTDYIEEIIDKAQAYNATYYDSLIQSFSGLGKTPAEIDRYIWGNYLETAKHDKRPLSKLTRDVLEQIGIITPTDF